MSKRLAGKIALITGASQGIGKACAEAFIKEGAFVFLSDIADKLGEQVAKALGPNAYYLHLDVQEEGDWDRALHKIQKEKGYFDILVNNAGVTGFKGDFGPQDPEHASLESWRKVHAINSDSVFLGCKKAIGIMKKGRGSIVNLSSRSGVVGIPGAAAYASSKASIRNHTKSVALYCCQKKYDIRCNSVQPAAILTPMWEEMLGKGPEREKRLAETAAGIPMGRLGTPEDVAYAVVFLASDESKYMTGSELTIDGGILAGTSASPNQNK